MVSFARGERHSTVIQLGTMAKHSRRRRRRRPPQDIPCLLGWVARSLCDGSKAEKTIPKDESSSALKPNFAGGRDEAGHGNRRKWFDFRWFLTARNDDCHKFRLSPEHFAEVIVG